MYICSIHIVTQFAVKTLMTTTHVVIIHKQSLCCINDEIRANRAGFRALNNICAAKLNAEYLLISKNPLRLKRFGQILK